jgi:hypothetical protein
MFCNKCGRKISDNMKFCPYCGSKAIKIDNIQQAGGQNANENIPEIKLPPVRVNTMETDQSYQKDLMQDHLQVTQEKKRHIWIPISVLVGIAVMIIAAIFVRNNGEHVPTQAEAKKAFQTLFEQALEDCRNDDEKAFFDHFRYPEGKEDQVSNTYKYLKDEYLSSEYPDTQYACIGDGTYYIGAVLNTISSGQYPNTKSMNNTAVFAYSYKNGKWKFDGSDSAQTAFMEECTDLIDPSCKEAYQAGRNFRFFGSDFSWIDNDIVIPGVLAENVYVAWQNEDGSVGYLLNIKNGTDEIRYIYNIVSTFTDKDLGEICSSTVGDEMIAPGTSKNYIITVDADDVNTGNKKWGSVEVNCDCDSD